jgi:pseudaminic acid synthase
MRKSTYIIAELSANHGHKLENALASVRAAKAAGADAIKIQTYTADTITLDCDSADFQVKSGTLWDGTTLYKLYKQAYTPWEWHQAIFDEAKKIGIDCFSTPFDKTAVDFLEQLGNPIYKIASFEITDIPLIKYAASKHKPMIISTGIATLEGIQLALDACHRVGNYDVTLLHCVSAYPAPLENVNLRTMMDMADRYGVKVGLSDHTMGADVSIAAVALGATMIEKHFILDRSIGGPDAAFSMQQDEFTAMVQSIRNVEKSLGSVQYKEDISQIPGREFARSLYVAKDIKKGEVITENNVRSVRPGYGLHPKYLCEIVGRRVNQDLQKGMRMDLRYITTQTMIQNAKEDNK